MLIFRIISSITGSPRISHTMDFCYNSLSVNRIGAFCLSHYNAGKRKL